MIALVPGRRFDGSVLQILELVKDAAVNARSTSTSAAALTSWVTESEWRLRNVLLRSEIDRLLHTPRYWHVVSSPHTTDIQHLASDEMDDAKWR